MSGMKLSVAVLSLSSLLWSCGGGSGTDQSKKLSDLTEQDIAAICQESIDLFVEHMGQETICKLSAVIMIAFGDQEQCNSMYTQCMATPFDPITTAGECDLSEQIPAECDATVGEFMQCEEEAIIFLGEILSGISCSSSMEDLAALEGIEQGPQSCIDLAEKCPNLGIND